MFVDADKRIWIGHYDDSKQDNFLHIIINISTIKCFSSTAESPQTKLLHTRQLQQLEMRIPDDPFDGVSQSIFRNMTMQGRGKHELEV